MTDITVGTRVRLTDSNYTIGVVTTVHPDGRCVVTMRSGGTMLAPKHLLVAVEDEQ